MNKLEHIGIAVKNLEEANLLFTRLLGSAPYKTEIVEREGVKTAFFKVGDVKIELLEATRPDSPIARFIEKKGRGYITWLLTCSRSRKKWQASNARVLAFWPIRPNPVPTTRRSFFCIPRQLTRCWLNCVRIAGD